MSHTLSTRPCRKYFRLPRNFFHLNFPPPPPKQPRVLSHLVFKKQGKNTIWRKGSSHSVSPLPFQLDHAGNTSNFPEIHISTSTPPPLQNNHGSFVILSSKKNKNTIWRKGSSLCFLFCLHHLLPPLCPIPFQPDHAGNTSNFPEIHINFHPPPLQNNHGSFVILSSKNKAKTPFGGRVVPTPFLDLSHHFTTCTMFPTFSTGPCMKNLSLAKDSHQYFLFPWNM